MRELLVPSVFQWEDAEGVFFEVSKFGVIPICGFVLQRVAYIRSHDFFGFQLGDVFHMVYLGVDVGVMIDVVNGFHAGCGLMIGVKASDFCLILSSLCLAWLVRRLGLLVRGVRGVRQVHVVPHRCFREVN